MATKELMLNGASTTYHALDEEYVFQARDDKAKYGEVMKPWETDSGDKDSQFGFGCCTEYTPKQLKPSCGYKMKRCVFSCCTPERMRPGGWTTSVYHKKESDRLVIKRNNFEFDRRPKALKPCCCMRLCCCCCYPICIPIQEHESLDMVTQSIPIQSIFFVERNVTQKGDVMKPEGCWAWLIKTLCCCFVACCFSPKHKHNLCQISIGYNRSNESNKIHQDEVLRDDKKEDYITLTLEANQAFNLHRYLNDILDLTAPRKDILVDSGLPR